MGLAGSLQSGTVEPPLPLCGTSLSVQCLHQILKGFANMLYPADPNLTSIPYTPSWPSLCAPRGVSALLACVSSAAAEKMERAQLYEGELLGILQTPR